LDIFEKTHIEEIIFNKTKYLGEYYDKL